MAKCSESKYVQHKLGIKYTYAKKWYEKRKEDIFDVASQLPYDGTPSHIKLQNVIDRWLAVQPYNADLEISTNKDKHGRVYRYPIGWLENREKSITEEIVSLLEDCGMISQVNNEKEENK